MSPIEFCPAAFRVDIGIAAPYPAFLAMEQVSGRYRTPPGTNPNPSDSDSTAGTLWNVAPHHPITAGVGDFFELPHVEMYSFGMPQPNPELVLREFLALHERFLASGIRVLAHPFRVLGNMPFESDTEMLATLVKLLKKNNVAAELNFHHAGIPQKFATMCLESGVKFTLGSDAHGLWELGNFARHFELLCNCGFNGNIADILIDPRQ